jgi:hypothetical protein
MRVDLEIYIHRKVGAAQIFFFSEGYGILQALNERRCKEDENPTYST